jgi:predicted aldo/keto reductase-like oxidoreductase
LARQSDIRGKNKKTLNKELLMKNNLSRRSFVKNVGAAGVAVGLAGLSIKAAETKPLSDPADNNIRNFKPTMTYRQIGTTGIMVSVLSLGTGKVNGDVLSAAIDLGVNFIHTSFHYMNGQSLGMVGKAIKGKADKVYIALKDDFPSIEEALKMLGAASVDFLMFNRHNSADLKKELPAIKEKFNVWRDKGLVKFAGLTVHKDTAAVLDVAADAGFFTCVMPAYPPNQVKDLAAQRDKLRAKKISLLAMKSKGELSADDYAAHIPQVLADTTVSTIIKGVGSLDELKAWSAAAITAKTGLLYRIMNGNGMAAYDGCGMCGQCEKACPEGIATSDIMRCIRYYHDSERLPKMASSEFCAMGLAKAAVRCDGCGKCEAACPQRLRIMDDIKRARNTLA